MSETGRRIVESMPRGQPLTTRAVASYADLAEDDAERHLEALAGVGVIEEVDDPLASKRVWLLPRCDGE